MSKLVLARPLAYDTEQRWAGIAPIGLAYLAAAVRAKGVDVEIEDGKIGKYSSTEEHAKAISLRNPDFVGISAMTVDYCRASDLAKCLKKYCQATLILGGSHANALPELALSEAPAFDFVIAGEGEISLTRLITSERDSIEKESIPGLFMRRSSENKLSGNSPCYSTNLEELPFPAWDLFPKMETYPVMWERGCPYKCVFCSRNMSEDVRGRSVEHVIEEITWIINSFSPKSISFQDETFGLNKEKTLSLLQGLSTLYERSGVHFTAQTRVETMTDTMAQAMSKAGFTCVELGVESGNAEILARSGKGITIPMVEKAVTISKNNGLNVWLKFILGLPGETSRSIRDTVYFASRLKPHKISLSIIVAYPGSQIYSWAQEGKMGYRLLTSHWGNFDKYISPSVELDSLPYSLLRKWQIFGYLAVYIWGFRISELICSLWAGRDIVKNLFQPHRKR